MSAPDARTALVTGASSGIGAATTERLLARGDRVVAVARRADRLEALAARHDADRIRTVAGDVRDPEVLRRAAAAADALGGGTDLLVANAGVMPLSPITECRLEEWRDTIDVNVTGVLNAIAAVLPGMLARGTGHVVAISSVAGRRVLPTAAVYCASKHAVHVVCEGLREELAARAADDGNRLRVTVIAPGVVDTDLPGSIGHEATRAASVRYYRTFPDPVTSDEVADAILWAADAPAHVGVNEIVLRPTRQVK